MLGRLLNERAPILAFSQRSRREREAESTRPPGKWEEGSEVGALTASREALSSVVGAVRKTVDRIRGRLGGRAASPAPAFIIDKSVSVDELGLLGDSTTPFIVGPWSSEVGFELSVTGFRSCAGLERVRPRSERIIAVSRGGASSWYTTWPRASSMCLNLSARTSIAIRISERVRGSGQQKQFDVGEFDRTLVNRVRESLGAEEARAPSSVRHVHAVPALLE